MARNKGQKQENENEEAKAEAAENAQQSEESTTGVGSDLGGNETAVSEGNADHVDAPNAPAQAEEEELPKNKVLAGKEVVYDRSTVEQHLGELYEFAKDKKEDELKSDHEIHPVHIGMILELGDRKAKNKLHPFSDGQCETIQNLHAKLKKAGKI